MWVGSVVAEKAYGVSRQENPHAARPCGWRAAPKSWAVGERTGCWLLLFKGDEIRAIELRIAAIIKRRHGRMG